MMLTGDGGKQNGVNPGGLPWKGTTKLALDSPPLDAWLNPDDQQDLAHLLG
jgi:hypothetical protein